MGFFCQGDYFQAKYVYLCKSFLCFLLHIFRPVNEWYVIAFTGVDKHQYLFRCAIIAPVKLYMTS